jgi:uncharacterized membrane protein required for colicin V production
VTPVETLWFGLVIVFAVTGVVRGFLRELGVTLVLVVVLFGLTRLSRYLPQILDVLTKTLRLPIRAWVDRDAVWLAFYFILMGGVIFMAYQGYVVKYPGNDPKGLQGSLLGLMIGVINGYLAIGTIWYYVDKYKAPVRAMGLLQYDYTPLAQRLVKILPPDLLNPYLPFLVVFMIILLILK